MPAASRRLKAYNHINSIHLLILLFLFPHTLHLLILRPYTHTPSQNKKCAHLLAVAATVCGDGGEFLHLVGRLAAMIALINTHQEQHMQKCVFIQLLAHK